MANKYNKRGAQTFGPDVRLALCGPPESLAQGLAHGEGKHLPSLLVSYVYLDAFLKNRARYSYRDWVMDSGAFSANASGKVIDLEEFTDTCKQLMQDDPALTEVFALDVIGDWRASVKNAEYAWKHGVPAIPTYHFQDENWSVLTSLARDYPKIALGGMVGLPGNTKSAWAGQCFARVWPKKIHGFGIGNRKLILQYPWHSVDATNWELGPCKYGSWRSFGKLSVRGSRHNLKAEVDHYLEIERIAQVRWMKEMKMLEDN